MNVFFYGLFMDEGFLESKGITPRNPMIGRLDDYELRIGERASLVRCRGQRVVGIVMDVDVDDVKRLYADNSVADYLPETVSIELECGSLVEATCFNLPEDAIQGTNKDYARALCELADSLGLDETYVGEINRLADNGE